MSENNEQAPEAVATTDTLTDEVRAPYPTEVPDTSEGVTTADTPDDALTTAEGIGDTLTSDEGETFPRAVVEKLRKENAAARTRAKDRDELAARLHTALVAGTGCLQDPSDLPYSEDHLQDSAALEESINELLARKPHLAARTPRGNIGQGATQGDNPVSLSSILRMGV